jgi:hypothetical protein
MKRAPKNLISFALAFFFASAVLCATMAASGQSLASASGCSQIPPDTAMAECDLPSYLCSSATGNDLLAQGSLGSARSNDSLKNTLGLALGACLMNVSSDRAPPGRSEWRNVTIAEPGKVSVRLFNSVLNL